MKWWGQACGLDGIDGDLDIAGGAVLESDRHGETRRQIAVHLALAAARRRRSAQLTASATNRVDKIGRSRNSQPAG